jgi:hypothetical protein
MALHREVMEDGGILLHAHKFSDVCGDEVSDTDILDSDIAIRNSAND